MDKLSRRLDDLEARRGLPGAPRTVLVVWMDAGGYVHSKRRPLAPDKKPPPEYV